MSVRSFEPTSSNRGGRARVTAPKVGPADPSGRRLISTFTILVIVLAVWWIGRTLIWPMASTHSAAALFDKSGVERSPNARDRLTLQAPDTIVIQRARALVEKEPLAAEAYAVLALAAQNAGQDEKAARLMQIAAAWWPRDLLVQSWLLARSLRSGDRQAAVARFDLITRVRPDSLDAMTEAIAPTLADPVSRTAMADTLAERPPWRTRFLDIAVRQWRVPTGLIALFERLQTPPSKLETDELRPYLSKLITTGQVDQAYLAWLRSLPAGRLKSLGYLYNGQFAYPVTDMSFDWQMPAVPGTRSSVTGPPTRRVLTVGFLGGRVTLQPIQHDLLLAPGNYRMTGRVSTDRLRAEQGIRWRLACLEHPDNEQASSEAFKNTTAWRDFAMDFTVPDTSCGAQILGLEVYARSQFEQAASGVVSFSSLDIQPR